MSLWIPLSVEGTVRWENRELRSRRIRCHKCNGTTAKHEDDCPVMIERIAIREIVLHERAGRGPVDREALAKGWEDYASIWCDFFDDPHCNEAKVIRLLADSIRTVEIVRFQGCVLPKDDPVLSR